MSDDLEVMVKENQVVSGQLVTIGADRENAHKEIQSLHARLANAEQTINMKETGLEDIRHAYEASRGKCQRYLLDFVTGIDRTAVGWLLF